MIRAYQHHSDDKMLRVYLDTSVIISLTDSLDVFHKQSMKFVDRLHTYRIDCLSSSPASWDGKQFNDKTSKKISTVNAKQGLSSLIAGKPEYIMRYGNFD